jgi:hypothetical protein
MSVGSSSEATDSSLEEAELDEASHEVRFLDNDSKTRSLLRGERTIPRASDLADCDPTGMKGTTSQLQTETWYSRPHERRS